MGRKAKFWVALLLLLIVVAICISPFVNLEPTTLKSVRVANLLFAALAFLVVLAATIDGATRAFDAAAGVSPPLVTAESTLELNCIHVC